MPPLVLAYLVPFITIVKLRTPTLFAASDRVFLGKFKGLCLLVGLWALVLVYLVLLVSPEPSRGGELLAMALGLLLLIAHSSWLLGRRGDEYVADFDALPATSKVLTIIAGGALWAAMVFVPIYLGHRGAS